MLSPALFVLAELQASGVFSAYYFNFLTKDDKYFCLCRQRCSGRRMLNEDGGGQVAAVMGKHASDFCDKEVVLPPAPRARRGSSSLQIFLPAPMHYNTQPDIVKQRLIFSPSNFLSLQNCTNLRGSWFGAAPVSQHAFQWDRATSYSVALNKNFSTALNIGFKTTTDTHFPLFNKFPQLASFCPGPSREAWLGQGQFGDQY